MRADSSERVALELGGWHVSARSWGAQLDAADVDRAALRAAIARVAPLATTRSLNEDDVAAVLALDERTLGDYPGGPATRHQALSRARASVNESRYGVGAFSSTGQLLAMSYLDVDLANATAETDFTVVAPEARARGLGRAVKADAVLTLLARGVRRFRTGGSSENSAIIATNNALGYVRDEEWVTLMP